MEQITLISLLKEEGHHLNEKGNEIIYNAVAKYIDELI